MHQLGVVNRISIFQLYLAPKERSVFLINILCGFWEVGFESIVIPTDLNSHSATEFIEYRMMGAVNLTANRLGGASRLCEI